MNKRIFLILIATIFSCKPRVPKNIISPIEEKQNEFISLEIRIPFEISCYFDDQETFDLLNTKGDTITSTFDTITKTGRYIEYSLNKGHYNYSIRTPFNEKVSKSIDIERDTSYYFYHSIYEIVDEKFSLEDLASSQKINILINYATCEGDDEEIEIKQQDNKYFIQYRNTGDWTDQVTIDSTRIINNIKYFQNDIDRLYQNEVFDEDITYYMNATKVFIKYDNSLYEVYNLKMDSLLKVVDQFKKESIK